MQIELFDEEKRIENLRGSLLLIFLKVQNRQYKPSSISV